MKKKEGREGGEKCAECAGGAKKNVQGVPVGQKMCSVYQWGKKVQSVPVGQGLEPRLYWVVGESQ